MIKTIKSNESKKNLIYALCVVGIVLLYNLFLIIDREVAARLDAQTNTIQESINLREDETNNVSNIIKVVEIKYKEYLKKINEQKNLIIDANTLNSEIQTFTTLLNQYYDNSIFKIRLLSVKQDDEFLNIGNIVFSFDFMHDYSSDLELSNNIENTIIKNVFYDLIKNFAKDLSVLEEKSFIDLTSKTINIAYLKEKQ